MTKRINPMTVYILILNANRKSFVESLTIEQQELLEYLIKDNKPEECICCPCFAWDFDDEGRIAGCTCTLCGEPNPDGKGNCNFD